MLAFHIYVQYYEYCIVSANKFKRTTMTYNKILKCVSLSIISFFTTESYAYEACYSLTEVTDESTITTEDFTVTKYFLDSKSNEVKSIAYKLTFGNTLGDNQSEVGENSATRYFKWKVDDNGNKYLANTGPYDTAKAVTAYSSNNIRLDTTNDWAPNDLNHSFLDRGTAGTILYGGAIYNAVNETIYNLNGDFIGNFTKSSATSTEGTYGGAIYNGGSITEIKGNFISNTSSNGGAIYNTQNATINKISGNFIGNVSPVGGPGGAINNNGGTIKSITGNFINNYAANSVSWHRGGAIYTAENTSFVDNINGEFIGNKAAEGGAVCIFYASNGTSKVAVNSITGNFNGNIGATEGGAIDIQRSFVKTISGNFINNYITPYARNGSGGSGGAIYVGDNTGSFSNIYYLSAEKIEGNFIGNSAAYGGAIYLRGSVTDISGRFEANKAYCAGEYFINSCSGGAIGGTENATSIKGDFIRNTSTGSGGALYGNGSSNSPNISGSFIENSAVNNGGAIFTKHNNVYSDTLFKNNSANGKGGAIYVESGSYTDLKKITFNVNKNITNSGNFVEKNGVKDDTAGGFIYAVSASVDFNINKNATYTIGDGRTGYDSIVSETADSVINKNGDGKLVVNSSMEYFIGSLNVNRGEMAVNEKLGASSVRISFGSTLSAKISGEKVFTNSALNYSNDGTLLLIADENLKSGNYTVSAFANPEEVYFGNVKTYGGTFEHATGSFIVKDAHNMTMGTVGKTNVESNGRVIISGAEEDDTSVVMNFNSTNDITVNSVTETTTTDAEFNKIINEYTPECLQLAQAFDFDVESLTESDSVNLNFRIGGSYNLSQITVFHKGDGNVWEVANALNLAYNGEILSFTVKEFSSYGYIIAVPEPAEWTAIFGALALGLAVYRRRK